MQLIITAITKENLQEGQIRESHRAAVCRSRLPGLNSQLSFFQNQPQTGTIETDLDLAAVPYGNRFGQALFEGVTYNLLGDRTSALAAFELARRSLERELSARPDDPRRFEAHGMKLVGPPLVV